MTTEIEPTPEDWERVRRTVEDPRRSMLETMARVEARRRVDLEHAERRRRRINRLTLGLFGRA